jgi:hypothetical protein
MEKATLTTCGTAQGGRLSVDTRRAIKTELPGSRGGATDVQYWEEPLRARASLRFLTKTGLKIAKSVRVNVPAKMAESWALVRKVGADPNLLPCLKLPKGNSYGANFRESGTSGAN